MADPPVDDAVQPGGWVRSKVVTMTIALAFLAGAIGYVTGVRTSEPTLATVDRGFLVDMTLHHDQAVVISITALANLRDPAVRGFAMEVILFQRFEIGRMAQLLAEAGLVQPTPSPDMETMAWMGHPTPLSDMPGLASPAQLEALEAARGTEADLLFLELMAEHHRGGLHMAEVAADRASNIHVRSMAEVMAENQAIEIREYAIIAERLETAEP